MSTSIQLVTKRVSASAHIRHTVTVSIAGEHRPLALLVPARRGPIGRPSHVPGPPGPSGTDPDIPSLSLLFENQLI